MLKLSLVVVGDRMPGWVNQGYLEYAKRISGRASLELIEIAATRRGKNADLARIARDEEKKIFAAVAGCSRIVALDRVGQSWSTMALAGKMRGWIDASDCVALVVGGPEGLGSRFISAADDVWSLSELTFAHPLVRVILAEQLYRSYSILQGSPYHR